MKKAIRGRPISHGQWNTITYGSWRAMKRRCSQKMNHNYNRYGARGITVCVRWLNFKNFWKDMGNRPTPQHTLDRIDGDKGYFKTNCRWATHREQWLNRCSTKLSDKAAQEIRKQKKQSKKLIAAKYGVSTSTVYKILSGARWKQL